MSLIGLIVVLVIVGLVLYLINAFVPLQPPFKTIINVVVVLVLCLWLLEAIGVFGSHVIRF